MKILNDKTPRCGGIVCQVHSDFLCVPDDAFVKTVSREFKWPLSRCKMCFDATLVAAAVTRLRGLRKACYHWVTT